MNKLITRFPLYLGIFVFIITILTVSIKLGESNTILSDRIKASLDEATVSLQFSLPNIISLSFVSSKEISAADLILTYNKREIVILPSTLMGMSGFITTGGQVDSQRGVFTFSAVGEEPIKTGILATFRVRNISSNNSSKIENVKVDFSKTETKVYDRNMVIIPTHLTGLDF